MAWCSAQDACASLHLTVRDVALRRLLAIIESDDSANLDLHAVLDKMRETFASVSVKKKAHTDFISLSVPVRAARRDLYELDAVNSFLSHVQAIQEQLGPEYRPDAILRDRLIHAF